MWDALIVFTNEERPEEVCGADDFAVVAAIGYLQGEADIHLSASTAATSLTAMK